MHTPHHIDGLVLQEARQIAPLSKAMKIAKPTVYLKLVRTWVQKGYF
jgi:hypothetical protein